MDEILKHYLKGFKMKLDYLCSGLNVTDDEQAIKIFRCIRWASGIYCPKCKSFEKYWLEEENKENLIDMFVKNVTTISIILQGQCFIKVKFH